MAPKVPTSMNDDNSAIAISVGVDSRSGWKDVEMVKMEKLFFIRLNNESDNLKNVSLKKSNFYYESLMVGFQTDSIDSFLMNTEPGVYAAVGGIGVGMNSGARFYIYFSKEMIKKTIIEAKPGTIVYMGDFVLENVAYSYQMHEPDELQTYYFTNLLFDDHKQFHNKVGLIIKDILTWYTDPQFHSPKLYSGSYSKETERKFLNSHLGTFKGTEWVNKIKNRISEIE